MISIDTILEENGINLDEPVQVLKSSLNSCLDIICNKTVSINGWDMSHMFQITKDKSLFELQEIYKERKETYQKYVLDNVNNLEAIRSVLDKIENECYYLSDVITKTMIGK